MVYNSWDSILLGTRYGKKKKKEREKHNAEDQFSKDNKPDRGPVED